MSDVATAITPVAALRLIAQHGGRDKTAVVLREEADRFDEDAYRRERVAVATTGTASNRKRARSLSRVRKATQQRGNAHVCRLAAGEIERRKVTTVGQALRPWPLRVFAATNPHLSIRYAGRLGGLRAAFAVGGAKVFRRAAR